MRFFLIILLTAFSANAQKSNPVFEINVEADKSMGSNIIKTHYLDNSSSFEYYSRRRYKHPYLSVLVNVMYRLTSKGWVGAQTGIECKFLEQYFFADVERTSVSIPIQLTGRYQMLLLKGKSIGINLAAGMNLFDINQSIEHYKNGKLFSGAVYYKSKKSVFKLGANKQVDNVRFYVGRSFQNQGSDIFRYKLRRTSISLAYGITL